MKKFSVISLVILSLSLIFSCSDKTTNPDNSKSEFTVVREALDTYVSGSQSPVIKADGLHADLANYFVVSVRAADDYAKGHVPGAINIPWRTIAQSANIDKLPTDGSKIATYCYTGHTGQIACTVLNALGFNAINMKYGMMAWMQDGTVRVQTPFTEEASAHDYATETTINTVSTTYDLPSFDNTTSTDETDIILAAADHYVSAKAPVTSAEALYTLLNDGDASNDPQIVSVRNATDYAKGHIPGAINIPWKEIAKEDNLKKLDSTKPIVVYCYTGHTGQIGTTVLNMLGYDALNLKFGIMSWTKNTTVRVQAAFSEEADAHNYELNSGTNP